MRSRRIIYGAARLLAWAAGGAVVAIAVAWGLCLAQSGPVDEVAAIRLDMTTAIRPLVGIDQDEDGWPSHWFICRLSRPGAAFTRMGMVDAPLKGDQDFESILPLGCDTEDLDRIERGFREGDREPRYYYTDERGWPFLSLGSQWDWFRDSEWPPQTLQWGIRLGSVLSTSPWAGGHLFSELRALPLRPLWYGFALNSLFYAAGLRLLCAGPSAMRRAIRRRRRRCARCDYPVGSSPVCTECGTAVFDKDLLP